MNWPVHMDRKLNLELFSSIPVLLIALMDDGTTGYKLVLHNIYFYVFAIY